MYLVVAGSAEIGWPVGLKWAQEPGKPIVGVALAVVSMAISGALLFLAQRKSPSARPTPYGPGSVPRGTFLVGIWLFGDASTLGRYLGVVLDHCRGGHTRSWPTEPAIGVVISDLAPITAGDGWDDEAELRLSLCCRVLRDPERPAGVCPASSAAAGGPGATGGTPPR